MKVEAVEEGSGGHKHSRREISRVLAPGWMKSERGEESRGVGNWMDGETINHGAAGRSRGAGTQGTGGDYKKQLEMQIWAHGLLCDDCRLRFLNKFVSGGSLPVVLKSELISH